jgi:ADP-ribose pyrophosphatase YjhB (NUDIX family)
MTYDIYSDKAIDLVLFTVVDEKTIRSKVWDDELISPARAGNVDAFGLSLFVVTVPADTSIYPDAEGKRVLPGGYLGKTESLEQASRRILEERLGLSLKSKIRQLGIFDDPKRDPNDRVLSFAYWGMVNFEDIRKYLGGRDRVGLELVNSDWVLSDFCGVEPYDKPDVREAKLSKLAHYDGVSRFGFRLMPNASRGIGHKKTLTNDLPGGRILALDHDDMVFYAWRALRHAFDGRLDPFRYLGINPLGEEFRLSDLQEFTEVCRGEHIQRDLFRRQMTGDNSYLKPTNNKDGSRPGKPANLYSLQAPPVE